MIAGKTLGFLRTAVNYASVLCVSNWLLTSSPRDNIRRAVESGFRRSVHVDRRGFCQALWSDVSASLGLDDFFD